MTEYLNNCSIMTEDNQWIFIRMLTAVAQFVEQELWDLRYQ